MHVCVYVCVCVCVCVSVGMCCGPLTILSLTYFSLEMHPGICCRPDPERINSGLWAGVKETPSTNCNGIDVVRVIILNFLSLEM